MNSSEQREEAVFEAALQIPAEQRGAYLDKACGEDVELRRRVDVLLQAFERADGFLKNPAVPSAARTMIVSLPVGEKIGDRIERYKLLEQVGEGGCGIVYVAEQEEPVRRRVALKVIKLGMDTKSVIARFEAERQALAMMDHPNIAKVLDAGTTDQGRPYFVMELVRGIRITDYCDQNHLSTEERLDLFIKVCQAIQHAHQKGIIHRDIKPSNILVTLHDGVPVPKVIDFGIAKATEGRLTDATVYTQLHQFIGTPAYMSPEQAEMSGLDIDTRSDIYSLGVLLYELLAGTTPFDPKELMASGLDAMRKTIREKEPMRPSTRLATLRGEELTTTAKRRSAEAPKLIHILKGDLDWIVMKCLEKDRQRRYHTANGLAADLKRHLDNEPVLARPASTAYRFQKVFRRNKVMAVAAMLVLTAILMGTVISIGQMLRARRELRRALSAEAQALDEKANAQAALRFIQEDVLSQANPGIQPERDLTVRALLDRVAKQLERATGRPPLVDASIRQTLGSVYTELGEYAKAIEHYEAALRVQRERLGENHLDTLRSLNGLATAHWWGGEPSLAEPLTRQGLETSRRTLGEKHPLTLQFMQTRAFALMALAEMPWKEVETLFLQTLAVHREVLGPDAPGTLRVLSGLGMGYMEHEQVANSERLLVEAVDQSRRVLGEKHPITIGMTTCLAGTYRMLNQFEKAEVMARRADELHRSTLGPDHPLTMATDCLLAEIYVAQREFDKARPLIERALVLGHQLPLEKCALAAGNLSRLGRTCLEQGDVAHADILCDLAWKAMQKNPAFYPIGGPSIVAHLGMVRFAQSNYTEAEPLLREASRLAEQHHLDEGWRLCVVNLLGTSLERQTNFAAAEPLLLQSSQGLQQRSLSLSPYLNATHRITESMERLVQLYDAWGKPAQANEWRKKLTDFQQTTKVFGVKAQVQ